MTLNKKAVSFFTAVLLITLSYWGFFPEYSPEQPPQPTPASDTLGISSSQYYTVTEIVDGDTIKIDVGGQTQTVRLVGIDTPETKDPRKPVECFGLEATAKLTELIGDNPVRLVPDSLQSGRDRYGRLLYYIYTPDDTFINQELVASGYAFAYQPIESDYLPEFIELQNQARDQDLGLWGSCEIEH